MNKISNLLKLANYFYEINKMADEVEQPIDIEYKNLINFVGKQNIDLKGDLTFLMSLFNIFRKTGNGFNELKQAILAVYSEYISIYNEDEDDEENFEYDDYNINQMPEYISNTAVFLNNLEQVIKHLPKTNKSFTYEDQRIAKENKSNAIREIIQEDYVGDEESYDEYNAFRNLDEEIYRGQTLTDEQITEENKKTLESEFSKQSPNLNKSQESYLFFNVNDFRHLNNDLESEKQFIKSIQEKYGKIFNIQKLGDDVINLIDVLIPKIKEIENNQLVKDLKSELKELQDVLYVDKTFPSGKTKKVLHKQYIPGLTEKINETKNKINLALTDYKALFAKKGLAKYKFMKALNSIKFKEFELENYNYKDKSLLETIKIKNQGELLGLGTGLFSNIAEEKKLRKLIDNSIKSLQGETIGKLHHNESDLRLKLLTEDSIIKAFDRANEMAKSRKKNPTKFWEGTHSEDEIIKKFLHFSNLLSVFFTKLYPVQALAANIANDAVFDIIENSDEIIKFKEEREKLKKTLQPQIKKLEDLYIQYNTSEDIEEKTKLNKEILKLSINIKSLGHKLITNKQYPFVTKPKNEPTESLKTLLQYLVDKNISPYIERMEQIRHDFARVKGQARTKSLPADLVNAYKNGWFKQNFENKKQEVANLMLEFKALNDELYLLLPYFDGINTAISNGSELYNILLELIEQNYTNQIEDNGEKNGNDPKLAQLNYKINKLIGL